jgi:hypothetical protein
MNRRTFLLAVGATACGGVDGVRPRQHTPAPTRTKKIGPGTLTPNSSVNVYEYQRQRSSLAVAGDTLIQNVKGDLWRWDMRTRERTAVYTLPRVSYCFLQDGTFAVFARDRNPERSVLHRLHANGKIDTVRGPSFPLSARKATHVLPASSPAQVYVTRENEIVQLEKVRGELEQTAAFAIPNPNSGGRDQMFSLRDGRVVCVGNGFSVVQPSTAALEYATSPRIVKHSSPAPDDRVWYSFSDPLGDPINMLALTRLTTPTVDEHRVNFAPGHIVHLATGDGIVAVLVFTIREGGAGPGGLDLRYTVVAIDDSGKERWRRDVPAAVTADTFTMLSRTGFLAVTANHVVLRALNDQLLVWDASNGHLHV